KYVPLLTSRGCPFHCNYCSSGLLNPVFQEMENESIVAEIFQRQQEFHSEHFIIFDDALLINKKKRFGAVFSRLARELPTQVQFHAPNSLHTREIDEKTAAILKAARFKTLCLSFESLAPEILRHSDNKVNQEQMEKAVNNLEKAGYRRSQLEVYLLFGYPGQTMADMEKALVFVGKRGLVPHLALFSPVPGTADFIRLQQQRVLSKPINLLETNKLYFLYEKSGFSAAEIMLVKKMAMEIANRNLK
ncbi:MAG: radical SAM protein, partial [Chrysiogenales bacterium]